MSLSSKVRWTTNMPTDTEREHVLTDLVELCGPLPELAARLSTFPWDCEQELVLLQPAHIASVMHRYIAGELSASKVGEWADLIECRDDVGFGSGTLKETVYRLANQTIEGALTHDLARIIADDYDETT